MSLWPHPPQASKRGSIQADFVPVREITDTMMTLVLRGKRSFVTILAIEGIAYDLKSPEEQGALNEHFQALLAGLTYPVQILWRVLPLNLRDYLAQFEVPEGLTEERAIWELLSSSHAQLSEEIQQ